MIAEFTLPSTFSVGLALGGLVLARLTFAYVRDALCRVFRVTTILLFRAFLMTTLLTGMYVVATYALRAIQKDVLGVGGITDPSAALIFSAVTLCVGLAAGLLLARRRAFARVLDLDRMNQAFVQYVNQLYAHEETRKEFVTHISHDLLKPVASLKAYAEMIRNRKHQLTPAELDSYLSVIQKNTHSLDRLISALLELSVLEAPAYTPNFQSISLYDLLSDLSARFEEQAKQKMISLRMSGMTNLPLVHGDAGLLERALLNLIDNAIKYSGQNGTVEVHCEQCNSQLLVSVKDSGIGMSPEEMQHVGRPLYRAQTMGSDDPGGCGLGMAITRRIIELHGSRLEIQSAVHQGTNVFFLLPVIEIGRRREA